MSAKSCGCDPEADWLCREHGEQDVAVVDPSGPSGQEIIREAERMEPATQGDPPPTETDAPGNAVEQIRQALTIYALDPTRLYLFFVPPGFNTDDLIVGAKGLVANGSVAIITPGAEELHIYDLHANETVEPVGRAADGQSAIDAGIAATGIFDMRCGDPGGGTTAALDELVARGASRRADVLAYSLLSALTDAYKAFAEVPGTSALYGLMRHQIKRQAENKHLYDRHFGMFRNCPDAICAFIRENFLP